MSDMRASFEERDAYLDHLSKSYADGRLDDAEFERRRDAILASVTHAEIRRQFDGLPTPAVRVPRADGKRRVTSKAVARPTKTVTRNPGKQGVLTRRNAIIGGGAIVAAGVVGAMVVAPDPVPPMPTEIVEAFPIDPLTPTTVPGALDALRDQGFTSLVEFQADGSLTWGRALSADAPGQVTDFEMVPGQPLVTPMDVQEFFEHDVALDTFRSMTEEALQVAGDNFAGEPFTVGLQWLENGQPGIHVVYATGQETTGELLMDGGGRIRHLERYQ